MIQIVSQISSKSDYWLRITLRNTSFRGTVTDERDLKADWPASCDAAGVGGNGKFLTGFLELLGGRI
jgi:hypothetical protein